jgi:hypothetical protein
LKVTTLKIGFVGLGRMGGRRAGDRMPAMSRNGAQTPTMMAIASRAGQPPADRETMAQREVQASNSKPALTVNLATTGTP